MIPKQLFFIWFGNKPEYVNYSINTFKNVNPDFNIIFLEYSIDKINDLNLDNCKNDYDVCLYDCINAILGNNTMYEKNISFYKNRGRKFCQILANIYRLEILKRFGGIYLDCDTFPNKPFDEELLNRTSFVCSPYDPTYKPNQRTRDCFFIGSIKDKSYNTYIEYEDNIPIGDKDWDKDLIWLNKKKKFLECSLEYIPNNSIYYLDHYKCFTWNPGNCKTPLCKYDN